MTWILILFFLSLIGFGYYVVRRFKQIETVIEDGFNKLNQRIDDSNSAANQNFNNLYNSQIAASKRLNILETDTNKIKLEQKKLVSRQK